MFGRISRREYLQMVAALACLASAAPALESLPTRTSLIVPAAEANLERPPDHVQNFMGSRIIDNCLTLIHDQASKGWV